MCPAIGGLARAIAEKVQRPEPEQQGTNRNSKNGRKLFFAKKIAFLTKIDPPRKFLIKETMHSKFSEKWISSIHLWVRG
jgi:hypothetical protein